MAHALGRAERAERLLVRFHADSADADLVPQTVFFVHSNGSRPVVAADRIVYAGQGTMPN